MLKQEVDIWKRPKYYRNLQELGLYHRTDKATEHFYLISYEEFFHPLREKKLKVLEIGAGDYGASHRLWKDYFSQSEIYCMDTFHYQQAGLKEAMEEYGIHTCIGNQLKRDDHIKLIREFGGEFDIIIDDAAHMPDAYHTSLGCLFPHLKSGGLYIIEDLECATSRQERIDEVNTNLKTWSNTKHQVDLELHESLSGLYEENGGAFKSNVLTEEENKYLTDNIYSFEFYDDLGFKNNMCIIKKV